MIQKTGNTYFITSENSELIPKLPVGVFKINKTQFGFELILIKDKFEIRDSETSVYDAKINHIISGIKKSQGNIGVLFTGKKGSGKTYASKRICNELQLPVIIVENVGGGNIEMFKFLTGINQEVVYIIDEFEKNFTKGCDDLHGEQEQILTFMDGVYNTNVKKIFILTTNNLFVDDNLLGRPGRIKYLMKFEGFTSEEFIKDFLSSKIEGISEEHVNSIVSYLKKKKNVTIDILNSIVEEIEEFGIEEFLSVSMNILNIEDNIIMYYVICVTAKKAQIDYESFLKIIKDDESMKSSELYRKRQTQFVYNDTELKIGEYFDGDLVTSKETIDNIQMLTTQSKYDADNITYYAIMSEIQDNSF